MSSGRVRTFTTRQPGYAPAAIQSIMRRTLRHAARQAARALAAALGRRRQTRQIVSDLDAPGISPRPAAAWRGRRRRNRAKRRPTRHTISACAILDFGFRTTRRTNSCCSRRGTPKCVAAVGRRRTERESRQRVDVQAIGHWPRQPGSRLLPHACALAARSLNTLPEPKAATKNDNAGRKLLKYASETTLEAAIKRVGRWLVKGLIYPGETSLL